MPSIRSKAGSSAAIESPLLLRSVSREVMRLTPGNINTTPQDYISPASRRHVGLASPHLELEDGNDDAAEKRAGWKSKVIRHQASPATGTPQNRRLSNPFANLTNAQLAEHNANCIKLSAENKINAKNAFGLHLIDYMTEQIKKKDLTNFQLASTTLDASAKIYAGRVDAIHSDTYKMLGGLGRGADDKKGRNETDEMNENDVEEAADGKRGRKRKKRNTIEKNISSITCNKFDLEFEVDPLFSKTSAAFDEGGTSGLLLNHLRCLSDNSELILDSNVVMTSTDQPNPDLTSTKTRVNLANYANIDFDSLNICPAFMDFEFTNWNKDSENTILSNVMKMASNSDHAFDMEGTVEPIPETRSSYSGDVLGGAPCLVDADNGDLEDNDFMDGDAMEDDNVADDDLVMGDGQQARWVNNALNNIRHGNAGSLLQVLASQPGEYSYFKSNLLRTWAGPGHWSIKPLSKVSDAQNTNRTKSKSEKKEHFVDYSVEINFESNCKETRKGIILGVKTLNRRSKDAKTLPHNLHYEVENLFQIFTKPKIRIKRHKSMASVDDSVYDYDYDNANDKENFCPFNQADEGDEDLDDDNGIGFEFSQGSESSTTEMMQNAQEGSFIGDNSVFYAGDNMVSQPNKVAKIDINYAKTAKRIDVKKLKAAIWGLLAHPVIEDKENEAKDIAQSEANEEGDTNTVKGSISFQDLLTDLPHKVTKHTANNLSVPITFVCLLHLANEKVLKITSDETMTDVSISQGI